MSLSTAVIINVVLAVAVLGALGYVCRAPFRLGVEGAQLTTPSQPLQEELEQGAAWTNPHVRPLTEAVQQPPL